MSFTDYFFYIFLALLGLYLVFVTYKLVHELRYRRKPFIAMSELAWQSQLPAPGAELLHKLILVGDFGDVSPDGTDPVYLALERELQQAGTNTTLLFLGDNIYPVGLPPEGHRHREMALKKLDRQIELCKTFSGRTLYLSGNHDWNKGRHNGFEQLMRQENYLTEHLDKVYLPPGGCPGPVLVEAHENLALLVINTQWWVQRGDRPIGKEFGCGIETEQDFFLELTRLLEANTHRNVFIAAHHPLYSNALHGGKHTFKHHLFPLTAAHKKLYIPVPVAGSLYPLYRRLFGAHEDMSHPRYKRMRKKLLKILHAHKNVVYAAGHDHNLQHFRRKGNHYLVSGSASKTAYVRKGGKASFTHEHLGYMTLAYYSTGEVWLEVAEPDLEKKDGSVAIVYRSKLSPPPETKV